jgi:hypothetical protein
MIMSGREAMNCIEGVYGAWDYFDSREEEAL